MPTKRKMNRKLRKKTAKNRRLKGGVRESLFLEEKELTELPELEEGVKKLYCHDNYLTKLPELPTTLLELNCDDNPDLKSLPELEHTNLYLLSCIRTGLESLPKLPNTLKALYCEYNHLESLPELPEGIKEINCSDNRLKSLPPLLHTNLTHLFCDNNLLESLPELPTTLKELDCNNNPLTSFPSLPSTIEFLKVSVNQIPLLNIDNINKDIRIMNVVDDDNDYNNSKYSVDKTYKIIETLDALKSRFNDHVNLYIPKFEKFKLKFKEDVEKLPEEISQKTAIPKEVSEQFLSFLGKKGGRKKHGTIKTAKKSNTKRKAMKYNMKQ
jgi:hypothetical protein